MQREPWSELASGPFGIGSAPRRPAAITVEERDRLRTVARSIRRDDPELEPAAGAVPDAAPDAALDLAPGLTDGQWFVFEDHREIPLCGHVDPAIEQRMLLLAREGDLFAVSDREGAEFADYCARSLRLGSVPIRRLPGDPPTPIPVRCASDLNLMDELAAAARAAGSLSIVPFIGTSSVWALARRIAATGAAVRVAAPRPALTARTNDKSWFTRHAGRIVGTDAIPETWTVFDADELVSRASEIARRHDRLVVKVPNSAGGRGIVRLDADAVRARNSLVEIVARRLETDRWPGAFPLLVEAWEEDVLASPSVQTWIPPLGHGDPVAYGVFEQQLDHGIQFAGTVTSALPPSCHERLTSDAFRLAVCFQELGYVGPCSFDGLLVGRRADDAAVRWIECNGRWTSSSIAFAVAHRLSGGSAPPIAVVQRRRPSVAVRFDDVLELLADDAYHRRDDGQGVVILATRTTTGGVHPCLLVMGRTRDDVEALALDLVRRFYPDAIEAAPARRSA